MEKSNFLSSHLLSSYHLLPKKQAERYTRFISKEVETCFFPSYRLRNPLNLWTCYKILKEIDKIKPDIIHIQVTRNWFNIFLPFMNREYKLVATIHDVEVHLGERASSFRLFRYPILKYSSRFIVHGEYIRNLFNKKSGISIDKIDVIPLGALSIYKEFMTDEIPEEDAVLFFGRIWEYKGLRYLIEAEPLISKEIPKVKIIIAGKGENLEKYKRMMVHKEKFVIYNDYISNEMIAELFQKATVVVLPYIEASQSGVIAIAYSFGKPVVATNVGSIPEYVDDGITGYLVPPRDFMKLANAVVRILKDKNLRQEMGNNAFKITQGRLSWQNIADKTLDVYKKAISCKK